MQMGDVNARRRASFSANYPLWLIVRHFLNARLTRELYDAIVQTVTDGKTKIDDLIEESIVGDDGPVSSWTVRPIVQNTDVGRYLVRLLQSWIWQGDGDPGVHNVQDGPDRKVITQINWAFRLSSVDFGTLDQFVEFSKGQLLGVEPYVDAMSKMQSALAGDSNISVEALASELTAKTGGVLSALLLKHLGDLCADEDRWEFSADLYGVAETRLEAVIAPEWQPVTCLAKVFCIQSKATAAGMLDGPAATVVLLEKLVKNTSVTDPAWPVVAMNTMPDLMHAHMDLRDYANLDQRGATLSNPQLVDQHDLQSALQNAVICKYGDAKRFFWANLRRQVALGARAYAGHTKAFFAKAMIDDVIAQLDRDRDQRAFRISVRLLIESLNVDMVEQIIWTDQVIANFVDTNILAEIEKGSLRAPGYTWRREQVVIQLYSKWLAVTPVDDTDLARQMIIYLARKAIENRRTVAHNIGGDALKALHKIGKDRPEFRVLEPFIVSRAVLAHLESEDPIAMREAAQTAALYASDFGVDVLRELADNIVAKSAAMTPGSVSWLMARAAIAFLNSDPVMALAQKEMVFGRKVVAELIRLSLETSPDQDVIMYLLRNLPSNLMHGHVDEAKLEGVVTTIRKQALQTNSTAAADGIRALLVAPSVSKNAGIDDAIAGLKAILESATTDHPSLSFAEAFRSLLFLAEHLSEVARALDLDAHSAEKLIEPLFEPLLEMWRKAPKHPRIFNAFSLPPKTVPNPAVVHNWTFASSAFAATLRRLPELNEAMEEASNTVGLQKPISVARAIRSETDGANLLDVQTIRADSKEAFYAVMGQRLIALNDATDLNNEVILAMFDQCMHYGPDGMDAGLFVTARKLDTEFDLSTQTARAYRERLLANRYLRMSLTPLFERLSRPDQSEDDDG